VSDDKPRAYGFDPMFETIVVELSCSSVSFWNRVGQEVQPDRLGSPTNKLVLEACRSIGAEGRPPTSPVIVTQRLSRWHESGRLSVEELAAAKELLATAAEDAAAFDEDQVVAELAPVLRRAMEHTALKTGFDRFSKKRSLEDVERILSKAKRLGASDTGAGSRLGKHTVAFCRERTNIERLRTGVPDLDGELRGGSKRGTYCIVSGATGSGKSMFIDHVVAESVSYGIGSAIATLELGEEDHHARIMGNLVDIDYDDILCRDASAREAEERLGVLEENGLLGFCSVKYFTPRATTVPDLDEWITVEEQKYKQKIEVVGVDYGTLLAGTEKKVKHEEMTDIAESLRAWAKRRGLWLWVGNQVSGEGMNSKKVKKVENHHGAESKGIVKTADLHVTINPRDDGESIMWHVAKNRHGPAGGDVGPLPVEFEKGRVAPVVRTGWPF
jgi:replicative DNA helicase